MGVHCIKCGTKMRNSGMVFMCCDEMNSGDGMCNGCYTKFLDNTINDKLSKKIKNDMLTHKTITHDTMVEIDEWSKSSPTCEHCGEKLSEYWSTYNGDNEKKKRISEQFQKNVEDMNEIKLKIETNEYKLHDTKEKLINKFNELTKDCRDIQHYITNCRYL